MYGIILQLEEGEHFEKSQFHSCSIVGTCNGLYRCRLWVTGTYTMKVSEQEVTYELKYEVNDDHFLITTGTGSDPVIVDTFEELKGALQLSGTVYIRVDTIETTIPDSFTVSGDYIGLYS